MRSCWGAPNKHSRRARRAAEICLLYARPCARANSRSESLFPGAGKKGGSWHQSQRLLTWKRRWGLRGRWRRGRAPVRRGAVERAGERASERASGRASEGKRGASRRQLRSSLPGLTSYGRQATCRAREPGSQPLPKRLRRPNTALISAQLEKPRLTWSVSKWLAMAVCINMGKAGQSRGEEEEEEEEERGGF